MPNGLMGTTATPPIAPPAGRPAGIGGGLFGGSPYPVDPSMQPGLMQDAWRQFGLQLLSQAQNQNVGQGLASALAAGRQAYAGGAEQAYQVGREQDRDQLNREVLESRSETYRARADTERQEAQAMVEEMASDERGVETMRSQLVEAGFPNAALWGRKQVEGAFKKLIDERFEQRSPEQQEPILRSVPGVGLVSVDPETLEPTTLVQQRYKPDRPAGGGEPEGPDRAAILKRIQQLVSDGLSPEQARGVVVQELAAAQAALSPPPAPAPDAPAAARATTVDPVMTAAIAAQGGQPGLAAGVPPDSPEQPQTPSAEQLQAAGIDPTILKDEEALSELMDLLKTKTLDQIAGGG